MSEYLAGGYFLSKYAGPKDCTGISLPQITLAHDHTPRKYFPDSWALNWVNIPHDKKLEVAAHFGICATNFDNAAEWVTQNFDQSIGAWNVIFFLKTAKFLRSTFLAQCQGLDLWGIGLHQSLIAEFRRGASPPLPEPGYAPEGAGGIYQMIMKAHFLEIPHEVLGFEILTYTSDILNSPESLHVDDNQVRTKVNAKANTFGLLERFDQALEICSLLPLQTNSIPPQECNWFPFLIVRYL